jgi:DNA replication protein DnaC
MLSLRNGRKIAMIDGDKKRCIYLKEDKGQPAEIETTPEQRLKMFEKYLKLDKKMRQSDITLMKQKFEGDKVQLPDKLIRKFEDASEYVEKSLKKDLDYGFDTEIFPIIEDESYRMYISGLSGSGKSHFIANFLKHNKPTTEGSGIFLFSPIQNDKAMESIKNVIHLDLAEVENELGRELAAEDIPEGSVLIFDDIESFPKSVSKRYMEFRDICLERLRHRKSSTITVSHNATNGHSTKVSIRESQYWCLFPKFNARDTRNLLKVYGGLDKNEIDRIMSMNTRWLLYRKSVPKYAIGSHGVIALD